MVSSAANFFALPLFIFSAYQIYYLYLLYSGEKLTDLYDFHPSGSSELYLFGKFIIVALLLCAGIYHTLVFGLIRSTQSLEESLMNLEIN